MKINIVRISQTGHPLYAECPVFVSYFLNESLSDNSGLTVENVL